MCLFKLLLLFLSSSSLTSCTASCRAHWTPAVKTCSSPSSLWPICLRGWWRYSAPCVTCIRACVLFCVSSAGTLHADPPWHSCILSPPSSHVWEGCTGMLWTCLPSDLSNNEIKESCNYYGDNKKQPEYSPFYVCGRGLGILILQCSAVCVLV